MVTIDRSDFVVDLAIVDATDLARGGRKAANLGKLLCAGFPVPPGFVVTTAAYDRVVKSNELEHDIAQVSLAHDAAGLRAGFERARFPPELEQAILAGYRRLGGGSMAVRSSATAEDLPEAAFAGQQETFLGIVDDTGLLDAVRRCWASLWRDRAISYPERHGLSDTPVKLAVVVKARFR